MAKRTTSTRSPQDTTLRNIRVSRRVESDLQAQIDRIEAKLDQLMQQVAEIRMEGLVARESS